MVVTSFPLTCSSLSVSHKDSIYICIRCTVYSADTDNSFMYKTKHDKVYTHYVCAY